MSAAVAGPTSFRPLRSYTTLRDATQRETERIEWDRKPFREQTRFVCKACNGGWMSRLESASKPLLAPAIARTGSLRLAPASQALAATWAIKTVLVLQGTQADEPMAPADHFAQVREHERPPPGVTVLDWVSLQIALRPHQLCIYAEAAVAKALDDWLSAPEGPLRAGRFTRTVSAWRAEALSVPLLLDRTEPSDQCPRGSRSQLLRPSQGDVRRR
jgi:hypothetical protein